MIKVRYVRDVARPFTILSVSVLVACSAVAAADTPPFKLVIDSALGIEMPTDHSVLSDKHTAAMAACSAANEVSNGALFWLEINRAGAVTAARVRGSGKPAVDACLAAALRKATAADKLPGAIVVVGHIDLKLADRDEYYPSPRQSKTAVLVPAHDARWQVSAYYLAYTANRAADIAQALDGTSAALAACAPKRGASATPAEAIAWLDGKAIVRSGAPAYDACVASAFDAIKLPTADSAVWMRLAIMAPAEPLAPRNAKAGLSRDQALRDAMTTAVRSRKDELRECLDGKPNATLAKVGVALARSKATIAKVSTGDAGADACVRKTFGEVAIPSAKPDDRLTLEISLDRE